MLKQIKSTTMLNGALQPLKAAPINFSFIRSSSLYPVDPFYQNLRRKKVEDYSDWNVVKAVQYGIFDRVIELVESNDPNLSGFDVNEIDEEGAILDRIGGNLAATPLHWAIRQSHLNMVHSLLNNGADTSITDIEGLAGIHVAVEVGNVPVIAYLLARGIDVDLRDNHDRTSLMIACIYARSMDIFRLLTSFGANLDLCDKSGNTVAHYSVIHANYLAVLQLDKVGVNWSTRNQDDKLPHEVRPPFWLTERVQNMFYLQKSGRDRNISNRLSRLNFSGFQHSKVWRYRVTMGVPLILLLLVCTILNWDIASFLLQIGIVNEMSTFSYVVSFLLKMFIFAIVGFLSQRIINRFSDKQSQAIMIFSLASSTTLLLSIVFIYEVVPQTHGFDLYHYLFVLFMAVVWISFYWCVTKDPGYVDSSPATLDENRKLIIQLVDESFSQMQSDLECGKQPVVGKNPLDRFCTTCFVRKPLRSKHCASCDRCVAKFDHHCPWINNCVGYSNHHYFVVYLCSVTIACAMFVVCSFSYLYSFPNSADNLKQLSPIYRTINHISYNPRMTFCFVNACFYCFWTGVLFLFQLYQMILHNTTTNERLNMNKYSEFITGGLHVDGKTNNAEFGTATSPTNTKTQSSNCFNGELYKNPYGRGVWLNFIDLFHLSSLTTRQGKIDWRRIYTMEQLSELYHIHPNTI